MSEEKAERPKRYRVTSQRNDIAEYEVAAFTALSDEEARKKFEKYTEDKNYTWNYLKLVRFTEEIVEIWQKR